MYFEDNPALLHLLNARKDLEREQSEAREAYQQKTKALEHLNATIDYMRGWQPNDKAVTVARNNYDTPAIQASIETFFVDNDNVSIEEICRHLEAAELVPSYTDAVRNKVNKLIREQMANQIGIMGTGPHSKYTLLKVLAVGA